MGCFKLVIICIVTVWTMCKCDESGNVLLERVARARQESLISHQVTHASHGPSIESYTQTDESVSVKHDTGESSSSTEAPHRYQVAKVDFPHVSVPFIISLWIVIAGLAKIGFQVTPKLSHICPESCLLIVIGVVIGLILFYSGLIRVGPLTPDIFFLFLLPPIVLDAGYYMPNRSFFDNLATILLFAVVATVFNAVTIGFSLWSIGLTGLYGVELPLLDTILFTSIISAVDPVAVLAVFEEIQVNEVLYILVFGESLLNDAVTVVLYHMCEGYAEMGTENILPIDYVAGVASFFVVALGGTFVGVVWGIIAAFISRFTHHVRIIEPLFVFVLPYLSYLSAELFHLSGILALTFCGMTMKNYVEENISYKSHITVKYGMKMLASSAETIIFLFLGATTVNERHEWNTWFVIFTILFCSLYRGLGVIIFTAMANKFRIHKINMVEQFIMAYGGLRGAVAFALVLVIDEQIVPAKNMMVTTCIAVIYFTVFVQGMTIGLLVKVLNVARSDKTRPSMNERIHTRLIDHMMAGIEDLTGRVMGNYKLRDKFKHFNNRFIRPLLTREHGIIEPKIFETYSRLNLEDAMNLVQQNGKAPSECNLKTSPTLAMLIKAYNQNAIDKDYENAKYPEDYSSYVESDIPRKSSFVNIDLGDIRYPDSSKHLADAELHHILSDAMFQPPRITRRRYSRSDVDESNPPPSFHPQFRMPMKYFMETNSKKKKKPKSPQPKGFPSYMSYGINPAFEFDDNIMAYKQASERGRFSLPAARLQHHDEFATDPSPWTTFKAMQDLKSNHSLSDDDGITFTASVKSDVDEDREKTNEVDSRSSSPVPDVMTLPWKRDEDCSDGRCVRRQQEFPSWVQNIDYVVCSSPTHTFLGNLGKTKKKSPAIFEIFSRHNKTKLERMESIKETGENNDTLSSSSSDSRNAKQGSRDTVKMNGSAAVSDNINLSNQNTSNEVRNEIEENTKL